MRILNPDIYKVNIAHRETLIYKALIAILYDLFKSVEQFKI